MAKWFRDFPINLKNGNERVRSASESGSQTRPKPSFSRDSLKGTQRKDGGVGGLLAGRNRKNSATELGRNNTGTGVWDSLTSGKGRKNSKIETGLSDENRQARTSSLAQAYISRMIKVDKQDKTPKLNGITEQKLTENEKAKSDIKTTVSKLQHMFNLPFICLQHTHEKPILHCAKSQLGCRLEINAFLCVLLPHLSSKACIQFPSLSKVHNAVSLHCVTSNRQKQCTDLFAQVFPLVPPLLVTQSWTPH